MVLDTTIDPRSLPLYGEMSKVRSITINTPSLDSIYRELKRAILESATTMAPVCKHIFGDSRSGKSFIVRSFEAQYPAVRTETGLKKTVIYAQVPAIGTAKGLMSALLEALGDPYWSQGTTSSLLARLKKLLREVECKMIILDEFQHLADKGQKHTLKCTTDWLKALVERESFSLVCVGLPESKSIIQQSEQLRTRFSSSIEVPTYDWTIDSSQKLFRAVVKGFQRNMAPFEVPDLSSSLVSLRLYIACGGRIGLLSKILDRAVKNAVWEDRTAIKLEHLDEAFQEEIWFARKVPIANGPFLGDLSPVEQSMVCMQAMTLAKEVPMDAEDGETHLGTLQGSKLAVGKMSKKACRRELARALA